MIRWLVLAGLQLATMVPLSQTCRAQNITIVGKSKIYRQAIRRDSLQRMVELHSLAPEIMYDLRYASKNNFTGHVLYKQASKTFLRLAPARALALVQANLQAEGLGLKIFDAYRPHAATRLMWDLVHDERYVANPAKGSGHNRGLAVDLTLIDLHSGKELDMGTGFDNFTDSAHSDFKNLPIDVLDNRRLLRNAMERAGFTVLPTEWWHFYWPNNRNYDVLDLKFETLARSAF
ncbi:MAG: peptidase M15 [Sphingobacteriales bacterium]|nr:MAG: peptidase M15 [Sphingobacteriales bacterium]